MATRPVAFRDASPDPSPDASPSPVAPELLADVERLPPLVGWTLVPLLQVDHARRSMVVVWPAFGPGGELTTSRALVGAVLERVEGGGHRLVGETFDASCLDPDDVVERLGGTGFRVRSRAAGVPLEVLGERLAVLPQLFTAAIERGELDEAVQHAVDLSRLYGPWALQTNVSDSMLLAARGGLRFEHLGTGPPEGRYALLRLSVAVPDEPAGEAEVAARRLGGGGRWVVGAAHPTSP